MTTDTNKPNWNAYRNTFPDRYWKQSSFDTDVLKQTAHYYGGRCLDVGGGVFGTEALKGTGLDVYLLDPFVDTPPEWMKGRINWNDDVKPFDFIVLRGSINYLDEQDLAYLKTVLKPNGMLMANTFLDAPSSEWRERSIVNGDGIEGVETVRLNNKRIEHILIYPHATIEHAFYYYSKEQWEALFPNAKWTQHGGNSYVLKWIQPK